MLKNADNRLAVFSNMLAMLRNMLRVNSVKTC